MDPADHAPKTVYALPGNAAPEAAHCAQPILFEKTGGGLEVIDCVPPEVDEPIFPLSAWPASKDGNAGSKSTGKNRQTIIGCGIGALLLTLLAVCLGVGLGLSTHSKSKHQSSLTHTSTTTTASHTQQVSPTSKTRPITSGSAGIAAYDCNSADTYSTPDGTDFREECRIIYHEGTASYNGSVNVIDLTMLTAYTFESCMDHCAVWNAGIGKGNSSGQVCGAVTYNANLTFAISTWKANCFLKNIRGSPSPGTEGEDLGLIGSAYIV